MIDRAAGVEKIFNAFVTRDVGRNGPCAEITRDRIQTFGIARGNDDFSAFARGHFGGRKTDTGRATDHHDLLAFKHHDVSSIVFAVSAS